MFRVLVAQKKYKLHENGKEVVKTNEYQTFEYKGHILPKLGGVVENRLEEVLGYSYSNEHNKSTDANAPYDWTNPFLHIDKETIEKYEIKKEKELILKYA